MRISHKRTAKKGLVVSCDTVMSSCHRDVTIHDVTQHDDIMVTSHHYVIWCHDDVTIMSYSLMMSCDLMTSHTHSVLPRRCQHDQATGIFSLAWLLEQLCSLIFVYKIYMAHCEKLDLVVHLLLQCTFQASYYDRPRQERFVSLLRLLRTGCAAVQLVVSRRKRLQDRSCHSRSKSNASVWMRL